MNPLTTAALAAALVAAPALAQDRNLARNLAAQCANCHGTNGVSQGGIPGLAGQSRTYLVAQMAAFKSGGRTGTASTIMHQIAKGYSEDQIALMADYFAAQKVAK
jgi:cytochrome c553